MLVYIADRLTSGSYRIGRCGGRSGHSRTLCAYRESKHCLPRFIARTVAMPTLFFPVPASEEPRLVEAQLECAGILPPSVAPSVKLYLKPIDPSSFFAKNISVPVIWILEERSLTVTRSIFLKFPEIIFVKIMKYTQETLGYSCV
jgi:hypothetical protein